MVKNSISGENAGEDISQPQADHGQGPRCQPQVVPNVTFNVHFFADGCAQIYHCAMEMAALVSGAFFEHIYRDSLSHTVLTSFWSQTWSCLSTFRVRVGAMPTARSSL